MGMFTESPLFDDPSLPTGWYRKVVQRQTGATAGQWDVYVYNPEGKKFRSRNELRTHFNQIGSAMNSEDFDFSVKGKGHHNKGKSPTKKHEAENSKENQVSKKTITPVGRKSNTSKPNVTPIERPKRELRKRLHSKPEEQSTPKREDVEVHEEMEEKEEVSNVKLKVKVGYTATGAMIRPSTNGSRKKKRRFRNMHVKKKRTETKSVSKPPVSSAKRVSPVATVVVNDVTKEGTVSPRTRLTSQRNRKDKATEPVAGPSGLQKVKRSPRRILKRKVGGVVAVGEGADDSEEDDDEDLDYVCSLYPNKPTVDVEDAEIETGVPEPAEEACDPLQINEEDVRAANCEANPTEELHPCLQPYSEPLVSTNCVPDATIFASAETDPVEMTGADTVAQSNETEATDDHMQVVVIGDTVDVHNYAKPHSQ